MDEEEEFELKFCVLGDASVGKTCILLRYFEDRFDLGSQPTIGIDHFSKELPKEISFPTIPGKTPPRDKIFIKIWDTAGQERFQTFTNAIFQGTSGFILVYDITSEKSFLTLEKWIELITERADLKSPPILLLANKTDLDSKRVISTEQGRQFAEQHKMLFLEISALENSKNCVITAINSLVNLVIERMRQEMVEKLKQRGKGGVALPVGANSNSEKPSKSCC